MASSDEVGRRAEVQELWFDLYVFRMLGLVPWYFYQWCNSSYHCSLELYIRCVAIVYGTDVFCLTTIWTRKNGDGLVTMILGKTGAQPH